MTFYAKVLAVLLAMPVFREDIRDPQKTEQLEVIAHAVVDAVSPQGPDGEYQGSRAKAALLLAIGWNETGWSLRVHQGHCRRHECDGGRARGPWQVHREGMSAEGWAQQQGIDDTRHQAWVALKRLDQKLYLCRGFTQGALARYMGLPCRSQDPRVLRRRADYVRFLDQLERLDHDATAAR